MPCDSSYMDANQQEINSRTVLNHLKELGLKTGKYDSYYGRIETLDEDVRTLCTALRKKTKKQIQSYSLELQIWWRDHQAADRKRRK